VHGGDKVSSLVPAGNEPLAVSGERAGDGLRA
jgi:hypothetical protein